MTTASRAVREIGRDLIYYGPVRVIPAGLHLIGIVFFTRLLSPSEFGFYVLVISSISLFTPLILDWLTQSNLRYYERDRLRSTLQSFTTTSLFGFSISIAVALFLWVVATFVLGNTLGSRLNYLFRIGALTLVSRCGFSYVLSILRAGRNSRVYSVYVLLDAIGTLIIAVVLIETLGYGADAILIAAAVLGCGISVIEFVKYISCVDTGQLSVQKLLSFLKYGIPISAASAGSVSIMLVDRYMIGYFMGVQAVGSYSASYRISQMSIIMIAEILMLAAYPVVIQLFESSDARDTRGLLETLVGLYVVVLIPFVFVVAILSRNIADVLLGSAFRNSYFIFPWISIGAFCYGLTMYLNKPYELKERTYYLLYLVVFSSGCNILMNWFLIPYYGILGAAISSLVAYLIYLFTSWVFSRRFFYWSWPWLTIVKSLLAASIMALLLWYANRTLPICILTLLAKIVAGITVYSALMTLFHEKYTIQGLKYVRGRLLMHRA